MFPCFRVCFMKICSMEMNLFHGGEQYTKISAMTLKCHENQKNVVVCSSNVQRQWLHWWRKVYFFIVQFHVAIISLYRQIKTNLSMKQNEADLRVKQNGTHLKWGNKGSFEKKCGIKYFIYPSINIAEQGNITKKGNI